MNPWGLLLVAFGLFSMTGAIYDWDWFMNHPRARFVSMLLTRTGARLFYVALGIGLVVFGVLSTVGLV